MISLACVGIMLAVAYASMRDGLVVAFANLCNVLFGVVVAFSLWPFATGEIEPGLRGGSMDGMEDAIAMTALFVAVVIGLRFLVQYILKDWEFKLSDLFNKGGAFVVGMATGYFASGFLVCVLQTIPWHENFLGFEPVKSGAFGSRLLPGDQVVLKIMFRLNGGSLSPNPSPEDTVAVLQANTLRDFSRSFAMHRRFTELREVEPYFDPYAPPPPPEPKQPEPPKTTEPKKKDPMPSAKKKDDDAPPEVPPEAEKKQP